ncbi:MAG TPA: NAD(P)H-binding protein [Solirubrobacteraceae bacterium]|nr:NAD(P)H-binding protein [Solirubrobacteraceae bacterium]
MIIVTGATGRFGRGVIDHLLTRLPPEQIGASVRDPEKARDLAEQGVRVRRGDFADPSSLAAALEGASQVLVVSGSALGEQGVALHRAAIDAAYAAGAYRVLYTSHQAAANPQSLFAPARDHAATEEHLRATRRPYTALRNGYYITSLLHHLGSAALTGELGLPADGPVAWTAREDLAEAAAVMLAEERHFDGPTPPLVGAEALDLEGIAEQLSRIHKRSVTRAIVDDEAFIAQLIARGTPEPYARIFLGSYLASRAGEFNVADPTLEQLLGRRPTTVGHVLAAQNETP